MRLTTITNWAYGATLFLTLVTGATAILAANTQEEERAAVAQRYRLDKATALLDQEVLSLTSQARAYVISGDPTHLRVYEREASDFRATVGRLSHLDDAGASDEELSAARQALNWANTLKDEQQAAIKARQAGDADRARQIMFGAEYERDLDRVVAMVDQFQYRLDQRVGVEVAAATRIARLWRTTSEIGLGITGLLFLCVLYFILKRRILSPVVRLSDIVTRLAAQDYTAEPPEYGHVDEIGDISQAIRIFRENGLERQRLEAAHGQDQLMRGLLARMTQRMQASVTMNSLTDVIARFMPELFPEFAGKVYLRDDARGAMAEACQWSSPQHSAAEFAPVSCWALQRGALHRPEGDHLDVICAHTDADVRLDTICVPLTAQRETIGLLYLEFRSEMTLAGAERPETYLQMLVENIGLALANLRLRASLEAMAMADPLTGLANRRHLETIFDTERAAARHSGQPISCMILDVDHFKRFNDTFGHEAGDLVLREVGAILSRATREHGLACRYGGEEFLLLMPGLGPDEAMRRAEAVRHQIEGLALVHAGRTLGPATASFGVASAPAHCEIERIIEAADAAMYRAKEGGRNRVVAATARKTKAVA